MIILPPNVVARVQSGPPRNMLWNVDQFHYLGDLGLLEDRRAKLIDGVIVEKGPISPPHAIAATKTEDLIRETFGKGWHVRSPNRSISVRQPTQNRTLRCCRESQGTIQGIPPLQR